MPNSHDMKQYFIFEFLIRPSFRLEPYANFYCKLSLGAEKNTSYSTEKI
jgi:hypothetical protein